MTGHRLLITIDGVDERMMPGVIEDVADQMQHGASSGRIAIMGGIEWSMKDMPPPVDIDMRQRRAAALLLMAVGEAPIVSEMMGSVEEATLACPGLMATDLPRPTAEGRLEALREARRLIDDMLGETA